MSGANLTCPKVTCHGEFEYLGDDDGAALYKCEECGETLSQRGVEDLADRDGALAQFCRALLEGGS